MVHDKQKFYYQTWVQSVVPDFATVYVLDISGSMGDGDERTEVKYAITGEIYDYNCLATTTPYSKMYVYSAAKLDSMVASDAVFGTIPFGSASLSQIWGEVNPFIKKVMKHLHGSESMVTNLYYAIATTVERMFEGEGHTNPGASCALSAASFVMLTDESIFTSDTLDYLDWILNPNHPEDDPDIPPGTWYSAWFAEWQENATNKFPTTFSLDDDSRRAFCRAITNALKQMSYFYGVNFNWGLYGGLATSGDKKKIRDYRYPSGPQKGQIQYDGTAFLLNTVSEVDAAHETIRYAGGMDTWTVPEKFHVDYPHDEMCRIALTIPLNYVSGDGDALKSTLQMQESDKFNQNLVLAHFWRDSKTQYSAFRFLRIGFTSGGQTYTFQDKSVTLPSMAQMNLNSGTYHWETTDQPPANPTKTYPCNGTDAQRTYNLDYKDVSFGQDKQMIHFVLVKDS